MTVENKNTTYAIVCFILFIVLMSMHHRYFSTLLYLVTFGLVLVNGVHARENTHTTYFNKSMDATLSVCLIFAALIYASYYNLNSIWVIVVMLAIEFFINGLQMIAKAQKKEIVSTKFRHFHGWLYHISAILILLFMSNKFIISVYYFILIYTVIVGILYLKNNVKLLMS